MVRMSWPNIVDREHDIYRNANITTMVGSKNFKYHNAEITTNKR